MTEGTTAEAQAHVLEKAYDFKILLRRLKATGIIDIKEETEEALKKAIPVLFLWLKDSAVLSKTNVDNIASLGYDAVESLALSATERINPED